LGRHATSTASRDACMIPFGTVRGLLETLRAEAATEAAAQPQFVGPAAALRRSVRGVSTDTRSLKKGDAFVALAGENFDGHSFIRTAAERGAAVAIVANVWDHERERNPAPLPVISVADTLAAYGWIARAHRLQFRVPVVAVAGSNGKTSTKEMIADVLATRYNVLRTEGNLNNLVGVPAMLLRLDESHTAAVIEIGTNMPGEIERLCQILRPTHGIITNIGREHLELLGTIEGVAHEEGALFRWLAANGGTAFVNLDDRNVARLAKGLPTSTSYSLRKPADVRGTAGRLNESGVPSLAIQIGQQQWPIALQTPGLHTATNALCAAAVGLALKVPPTKLKRALESFRPPEYRSGYARLAMVKSANGATVLNDTYNANPDSTLAALQTLRALKPGRGGRRIAVLGDMRELGASSAAEHNGIGEAVATMGIAHALFLGTEMKHAYRAVVAANSKTVAQHFTEKMELIAVIQALLAPNDVVLVKGSRGMKMEEIVKAITNSR